MSSKGKGRPAVDDDVKARFRAALDAKQARSRGESGDQSEHGKVEHAHGPETSARQQMFRRKSG